MTALLKVPSRATGVKLYKVFGEILDANSEMPDRVQIDFSRLTFIEPPCVAFLGNLTRWLNNMGAEVEFVGMDTAREAIEISRRLPFL